MVKINWSNTALKSLHEASEFYRPYSVGFAGALIERVFEKVFLLENHPLLGRMVPEFDRADMRELLYRPYRIVYQVVKADEIAILLLHYGAKPLSLEALFG